VVSGLKINLLKS
jgi:hypothetical protein